MCLSSVIKLDIGVNVFDKLVLRLVSVWQIVFRFMDAKKDSMTPLS